MIDPQIINALITLVTSIIGYGALRAEIVKLRLSLEKHEAKTLEMDKRVTAIEERHAA